jgi:hypothetical protein
MSKSNMLSAIISFGLLATAAILLSWGPGNKTVSTNVQSQPTRNNNTASLQKFSITDMVQRSDRIFRGTVTDFEPGKVKVGDGELETVTYRFRVSENFKGQVKTKGDTKYAEITMLGNIKNKTTQSGQFKRLSVLPTPPLLKVGSDYLLLMTKESSIGLSSPIGLGQGVFRVFEVDKKEVVKNDFNNEGISKGLMDYKALADKIKKEVR